MFREYLIVLLLSHIIGDFYFQTIKMAEKKEENPKWLLFHCLAYMGAFLIIGLPAFSLRLFIIVLLLGILHAIVDITKSFYIKKLISLNKISIIIRRQLYIADQAAHIICLIITAYIMTIRNVDIDLHNMAINFFNNIGISYASALRWIMAFLLVHKPANVTISYLISTYRPMENEHQSIESKPYIASRFIGTIERIIILIFISIQQYPAIGLVLTAKSIARYDEISKNKMSAEYYLLGTLLSTVFAIVASFVIKQT